MLAEETDTSSSLSRILQHVYNYFPKCICLVSFFLFINFYWSMVAFMSCFKNNNNAQYLLSIYYVADTILSALVSLGILSSC